MTISDLNHKLQYLVLLSTFSIDSEAKIAV